MVVPASSQVALRQASADAVHPFRKPETLDPYFWDVVFLVMVVPLSSQVALRQTSADAVHPFRKHSLKPMALVVGVLCSW